MERIHELPCEVSQVPSTLHGQLFLLAFDPKLGRFDGHDTALFGFALRAAMLADLYLRGFLVEREGRAVPGKAISPGDLLLRGTFAQVGVHNRATWAELIAGNAQGTVCAVREQLLTEGWLRGGRYAAVQAVPGAGLEPHDACRVGALAEDFSAALRNAITGIPVEPWLLAGGTLAVLARLPGLAGFVSGAGGNRMPKLMNMAIAPVAGLNEVLRLHGEGSPAQRMGGMP